MDDSVVFCLDMLREVGLATVPGREFGPGGEGHVRLCFGRSEEEIEDGMVRMKKYLLKNKGNTRLIKGKAVPFHIANNILS